MKKLPDCERQRRINAYWRSPAGRATRLRYRQSKKGKKHIANWYKTPKGKAYLKKSKVRIQTLRLEVLHAYCLGGEIRCMCPGCTVAVPAILELDQVKVGASHRKIYGIGHRWYYALKRMGYPEGYRPHCPNCHKARHLKIPCPHHSLPLVKV